MIQQELKQLIEKYCKGKQPTDAQTDEIFDKALTMGADPKEVAFLMEYLQNSITDEQVTYCVTIEKVDNQTLAMMTARGALGWSSADSRVNLAKLPFVAKQTDNESEAKTLAKKLTEGGMTVSLKTLKGVGETTDIMKKEVEPEAPVEKVQVQEKQPAKHYIKIRRSSSIKATDDTVFQIVRDEIDRRGPEADLNHIDVSECTTFFDEERNVGLFQGTGFCGDVSKWDVSNVENMKRLFMDCDVFNCDLSNWDVSSVEDMCCMFNGCKEFNQDLGDWDVSNVKTMEGMFSYCDSFEGKGVNKWDVSNVGDMSAMFAFCRKFNQDLSGWDVSNVVYVTDRYDVGMFQGCVSFEGRGLRKWDVSSVFEMRSMFKDCIYLDEDLSNWDVSAVEYYNDIFDGCIYFDRDKWPPFIFKAPRRGG